MLTVYKAPRRHRSASAASDSSSSTESFIIPPGRPYITKVNGKLCFARDKTKATRADMAIDLLGEALGPRNRITRRISLPATPKGPIIINGITYMPQQTAPALVTAPVPQGSFPVGYPLPGLIQPKQPYSQYLPIYPPPQYPGQTQGPVYFLPAPVPAQPQPQPIAAPPASEPKPAQATDPAPAKPNDTEKIGGTKTTITIVKHICANCGRLRSRKYHHEHPIKEGETPNADYCRKCQRDASSTSESAESDRAERRRKKGRRSKKNNTESEKHSKKKVVESSSEESEEEPPQRRKSESKTKTKRSQSKKIDTSEDYIVVEEEVPDNDRKSRGRLRRRSTVVLREFDRGKDPPPRTSYSSKPHKTTTTVPRQETSRPQQQHSHNPSNSPPPIPYRHLEVTSVHSSEDHEDKYPKKIPVHYVDEKKQSYQPSASTVISSVSDEDPFTRSGPQRTVVERVANRAQHEPKYERKSDNSLRRRAHGNSKESFHGYAAPTPRAYTEQDVRGDRLRQPSFESYHSQRVYSPVKTVSNSSEHSLESPRRRRRRNQVQPAAELWEPPRVTQRHVSIQQVPRAGSYTYVRPRSPTDSEMERRARAYEEIDRRTQEYVDRTLLDTSPRAHGDANITRHSFRYVSAQPSQDFSAVDAERYFTDDWTGSTPMPQHSDLAGSWKSGHLKGQESRSILNDSDSSYDYSVQGHEARRFGNEASATLPPAPSPPLVRHSNSRSDSQYRRTSGESYETVERRFISDERRDAPRSRPQGSQRRARSTSGSRASQIEHDQAEWERPAGRRSRLRRTEYSEENFMPTRSQMDEAERLAEDRTKHVSFRDTPSVHSVASTGSVLRQTTKHDGEWGPSEDWDN